MIVTLTTDFGRRDIYAGVLKGVILAIAPTAQIVDLTHDVPHQDIAAASFLLAQAMPAFPRGTVHLAIVDPGVGSARRAVAVELEGHFFICPDNGLLSHVLANNIPTRAVELTDTQYHRPTISRTFHGRDIFGPVAAHLAAGVDISALGPPVDNLTTIQVSQPIVGDHQITAHIQYIDHYGNAITDLPEERFLAWAHNEVQIRVGETEIPGTMTSYVDVPEGAPLAIFGSSGRLEIAIRNGNAAQALRIKMGDPVIMK